MLKVDPGVSQMHLHAKFDDPECYSFKDMN